MSTFVIIRTSEADWKQKLEEAEHSKRGCQLINDTNIDLGDATDTLVTVTMEGQKWMTCLMEAIENGKPFRLLEPNSGGDNFPILLTSDREWMSKLAGAYQGKTSIIVIDNANIGIQPDTDSLLKMGLKAGLTPSDWEKVLVTLGVGAMGLAVILAAILDPEPTSKLTLLVGGGLLLVVTGTGATIYLLTGIRPPNIEINVPGFILTWGHSLS